MIMQANRKKVVRYLNVAKGQLDGVSRMVDNDAYCIDISNQVLAAISVLKKANNEIILAHLGHCVRNSEGDDLEDKLDEIKRLLDRID
ncbi:MAG: metal-sensing transcriptional repressor [Bacilli bacterium]|jgi:DNA-binding FrmR family transcriptional regulator|nr:metal-sensing transcriptional repressor [Bacilli bacterium]